MRTYTFAVHFNITNIIYIAAIDCYIFNVESIIVKSVLLVKEILPIKFVHRNILI